MCEYLDCNLCRIAYHCHILWMVGGVSRFVWESKELAVRYAAIAGAATLGVMIIGMEKL